MIQWLSANIAPVFKKGDVHAAENYRPVSLTCVSCKILEHIICKHIWKTTKYWPILTTDLDQDTDVQHSF